MSVTQDMIDQYHEFGYLIVKNLFSSQEVALILMEIDKLSKHTSADICYEDNGQVRAMHGCHLRSQVFERLVHQDRLVGAAQQFLADDEIYLHQLKINLKSSFHGQVWPWHQDHAYWKNEDGLQSNANLTAAILLDKVTELNAPIFLIPKSHLNGNLTVSSEAESSRDWKVNFGAKPKYTIPEQTVSKLSSQYGIVSVKGAAGTVVFFHSDLAHASTLNISPYDRRIAFVAYNRCQNAPRNHHARRPDFLASREFAPMKSIKCDESFCGDIR